ncbi:MAG: hypothetical protein ABII06_03720 [Pseudomonadota bacterium]
MLNADVDGITKNTTVSCCFPPRPRPKEVPAPDSGLDAFERIDRLLTGSRIEKKGVILTGTPESQAEGMLSFLKEQGFLKIKQR